MTGPALTRLLDALAEVGSTTRATGNGYLAQCPTHGDANPSLSIGNGNGKVVLSCKAGCPTDQVLADLSLTWADLWDDPGEHAAAAGVGRPRAARPTPRLVATYDYTDARGALLYQKLRYEPKTFRVRSRDSAGKEQWRIGDHPRVLYRLPEVIAAINGGRPVYVVEGEKDADRLTALGLTATCNFDGAGESKWLEEYSAILTGAQVVVIADNDKPGYAHAQNIAKQLAEHAASVQMMRVKPDKHGADVSDHLDAGHTIADLIPIAAPPDVIAPGERKIVLTRASDIAMRRVKWLWTERLPLGEMALLGGREGIGKSTVCYQLAADTTRGRLDGEHKGTGKPVIVAATEDSWEHTIVPRLVAADADLSMVYRVDVGQADAILTSLVLPVDLAGLAASIKEVGASLLLLDPLLGRLDSKLDTHKDADVRKALEPLAKLAHDCECSVLGLIHVNKSGSSDILTSLMASRAFTAVCRAVLFCMVDPDDETHARRVLGQPKNNLGRSDLPTLVFTIGSAIVGKDPDDGQPISCGKVVWQGESDRSVADLHSEAHRAGRDMDAPGAVGAAVEWLTGYLTDSGGRAPSAWLKRAAREEAEIPPATLKRAMQRMPVTVEVESRPGKPRITYWRLTSVNQPLTSVAPSVSDGVIGSIGSRRLFD